MGPCLLLAAATGVVAATTLAVPQSNMSRRREWWVGFGSSFVAVGLLATSAWVILDHDVPRWWAWTGVSLLSLLTLSRDWSRRWFVGIAIVVLVSGTVILGEHGYDDVFGRAAYDRGASLRQLWADAGAAVDEDVASVDAAQADLVKAVSAVMSARSAAADVADARTVNAAAGMILVDIASDQKPRVSGYLAAKAALPTNASAGSIAIVKAVDALLAAVPDRTTASTATQLYQQVEAATPLVDHGGPDWERARRAVVLALAQYRAQINPSDAATAAVTAAQQDLDESPTTTPAITWQSAIAAGPSAVFAGTFPVKDKLTDPRVGLPGGEAEYHDALNDWRLTTGRPQPSIPSALGWAAAAVLLLLLWIGLLARNAREQAGPATVPDAADNDELRTAVRLAVLTNIREPGAAPGSQATNPVSDLLALAGISTGGVATFVNRLIAITGRARGYAITYEPVTAAKATTDESSPTSPEPAQTPLSTLFQVRSITTGRIVGAKRCTGADERSLGETGGLWAAGVVLERSSRIPSWASWSPNTGAAVGVNSTSLEDLTTALRAAPNSGVLLVRVGNALEISGRVIEAIDLYARAVTAHPGYLVARYRLAAALGTLRHPSVYDQPVPDGLERGLAIWAASTMPKDATVSRLVGSDRADAGAAAADLSKALLEELGNRLRPTRLVWRAFNRSERTHLVGLVLSGSARSFRTTVRILHAGYSDTAAVTELVPKKRARGWWQSYYNLACAYAQTTAYDKAIESLLKCLARPGIDQLTAEWAKADPDLAKLRSDEYATTFDRFTAQLKGN